METLLPPPMLFPHVRSVAPSSLLLPGHALVSPPPLSARPRFGMPDPAHQPPPQPQSKTPSIGASPSLSFSSSSSSMRSSVDKRPAAGGKASSRHSRRAGKAHEGMRANKGNQSATGRCQPNYEGAGQRHEDRKAFARPKTDRALARSNLTNVHMAGMEHLELTFDELGNIKLVASEKMKEALREAPDFWRALLRAHPDKHSIEERRRLHLDTKRNYDGILESLRTTCGEAKMDLMSDEVYVEAYVNKPDKHKPDPEKPNAPPPPPRQGALVLETVFKARVRLPDQVLEENRAALTKPLPLPEHVASREDLLEFLSPEQIRVLKRHAELNSRPFDLDSASPLLPLPATLPRGHPAAPARVRPRAQPGTTTTTVPKAAAPPPPQHWTVQVSIEFQQRRGRRGDARAALEALLAACETLACWRHEDVVDVPLQ